MTRRRSDAEAAPKRAALTGSDGDYTGRLLEALRALEAAVAACPSGRRRRAAVELVVTRIRRLNTRATAVAPAPPSQLDLEDLLRKGR